MKIKNKLVKRFMSILLSIALLMTCVPNNFLVAKADSTTATEAVADPGTAYTWETMMGTSTDGNRYAGRVWVDKSVYTDGQIARLNSSGTAGSTFEVALEDDEEFQVIFSALGSSMTTTTTSSTTGPMDVVIILDNSSSMGRYTNSATKYSRLEAVTDASNELISQILESGNNRLAVVTYSTDASVILPLNYYEQNDEVLTLSTWTKANADSSGGVRVEDGDGKMTASATVLNTTTKAGTTNTGFQRGTNLQSGIDAGMSLFSSVADTANRMPVVVVLTDGVADTAVTSNWYNVDNGTYKQPSDNTLTEGVALSTLLNASYWKAALEDKYGKAARVYGVGVDLDENSDAEIVMNPAEAFNASGTSTAQTTYRWFSEWQQSSSDITKTDSYRTSWSFNQLPANSTITKEDVVANINYVDTYYDVSSANLEDTFNQIYEELSSGVFNPISSSTTVDGATGADNTPLIYVDNIGQYMEIKEIQAVTLFGASYGVVKNADGTYTVQSATGTNPTTNENYNTTEDILISVTENGGIQKLEIRINQEILPIILEQVTDKTVSGASTATINELSYNPLRVYYTVGLDSDILLPNGEINVSKIDSGYKYINNNTGEITFYSNAFGEMNQADANGDGFIDNGDAHVGFKPSIANRYYYHQSNHGIFTQVKSKENGSVVDIPENNTYGIVWDEDAYELTWMDYAAYKSMNDNSKVYTYVTYYRPTASTSDAANTAEKVTYLVYTDWGYLKESVAFYDATTGKYINYDSATNSYSLDDEGRVVDPAHIAAYLNSNPSADVYAVLGVGSLRTSRFHNMIAAKVDDAGNPINPTGTATNRYTPEYTHNTPNDTNNHYGNDVVVWLGNNGKLTRTIDTGIALTKAVTETIGNADDTYALTVNVPQGVTATPVVKDAAGNDVTATISKYEGNVLTVNLKAGETVYISGIPAGTQCTIGEVINGDYYIDTQNTSTSVTVPTLSQVLEGSTKQYAPAKVTNAPNKYGDLTIVKDISHHLTEMPEAMSNMAFTFKVQLPNTLAGNTYNVDKSNASLFVGDEVTIGADGSFTVILKDNESITILDLPDGISYTVTEEGTVSGYEKTTGSVSGTIVADVDTDAHFINTYKTTPIRPEIIVTGKKTVIDEHNTYSGNEEFIFALSQFVGVSNENPTGYITLGTSTATKDNNYSFNLIQLLTTANAVLDLGDHYFRVTEQTGNTAGMTYDSTRGLFMVKVTDTDANGILEYSIENLANTTINDNTVTKNFTNIYDVERTYADINITKMLTNDTGVNIPMDIFRFKLVNNNPNSTEEYTATTDASGKATIRISNLAEGEHRYILSEVNDGMAGMAYDPVTYDVNIRVTNNLGTLVAVAEIKDSTTINGDNTIDVSFENTYSLEPVKNTISGTKVLNGRGLVDNEFEFALYETDSSFVINNNPIKTTNNVGNAFAFDEITYTKVGTYYYSVKEIKGTVPGVTYDTTHYHVTVTVGIDSTDKTKLAITNISVNKIGANSDTSGKIVFVNAYKATPVEYVFSGTKSLTGRAMAAGEFIFELYEEDNSDAIQTATNKADGSFTFNAIEYVKPGEYKYTIKEVKGDETHGVTYDGAEHPINVTITVEDNVNTTDNTVYLSASADVSNENIKFENTYKAKPAYVNFKGEKTLVGGTLNDNDFTFKLYETDDYFNVKEEKLKDTKTNVSGKFAFEELKFEKAGDYFYAIVEDTTTLMEGIVYDGTQHNFRVQVSDIGDGQLRAVVHDFNEGEVIGPVSEIEEDVSFINATFDEAAKKDVVSSVGNASTSIDGEKVEVGDELTYYITYTNYTGEDVVVDIIDKIPAHTSYMDNSASHNGTYAGGQLNWVLNVAKGENVTVSFSVKVDEAEAIIANTAVVVMVSIHIPPMRLRTILLKKS